MNESKASWWPDLAIAVALVLVFAAFRPAMPDGDGLGHAERATQRGFLEGMTPKHLLYAPLLHGVFVGLDAVHLRPQALLAFTLVSNVAGALIYLLLARGVFSLFVPRGLAQIAALATALSYGVFSRSVAIETYTLALLMDVALVAVCLRLDLSTPRGGLAAGLCYVLAVGVHSTNVLMLPFVLVMLYRDVRGRSLLTAGWFAITVAVGALLLAAGALIGEGASLWEWRRLIPQGDPEPAMSIGQRLQRAVYGIARTLVWLPPKTELSRKYAVAYAVGVGSAGVLIAYVAAHGLWRVRRRGVWLMTGLLAIPYLALGLCYYPSDPERWLFLTPIFWLVVALAFAEYRPGLLSPRLAGQLLVSVIFAMAATNIVFVLAPEAQGNRDLAGLQALCGLSQPSDLVIAPSGRSPLVEEFVVRQKMPFEMVGVDRLMMKDHPRDVAGAQKELRERIATALAAGRRVLVFNLIDEGLTEGHGYPWAWVAGDGYTPDSILKPLQQFAARALAPPTAKSAGTFELK